MIIVYNTFPCLAFLKLKLINKINSYEIILYKVLYKNKEIYVSYFVNLELSLLFENWQFKDYIIIRTEEIK